MQMPSTSTLALSPLVRLLLAVLALAVFTVHSSESGCLAASPFGLVAGYSPSSNVSQADLSDVNLKALDTALAATKPSCTNTLTIHEAGRLSALSTTTKPMMSDFATGCPLNYDQMFYSYYGEGRRPC